MLAVTLIAQQNNNQQQESESSDPEGRFAVGVSGTVFDTVVGGRGAVVLGVDAARKWGQMKVFTIKLK